MIKNTFNLAKAAQHNFKAMLTDDQVQQLEASAQNFGQDRRLALSVLSRNRAKLIDGFEGDPDELINLIDCMTAYLDHLKQMTEIAETAQLRLFAVGSVVAGGQL